MTTFTEDQQEHMSRIVTFMMTWMRHQNVWLAAPAGSYAEEKAVEAERAA